MLPYPITPFAESRHKSRHKVLEPRTEFGSSKDLWHNITEPVMKTYCHRGVDIPVSVYGEFELLNKKNSDDVTLDELFRTFLRWCNVTPQPLVMIIDEVDTATNNQVFIDFLAGLRSHYLKREKNSKYKTFQSVILAGVTDVKHLKAKIRPEDAHKVNSPWNIAADFDIDMSLSETGIKGMLDDYETDHHTGMDTATIAKQIREYTNGYPYLVSRICQIIDEKLVPDPFATYPDVSV